ncbi:DUF2726 domain-containing protein [Pantoea agglomerans]|uniref:DUF2726 domain-containing protein n=1 Tax=Enterobacter agglomerans TaxID=549 RepID=UPI0010095F30|nr:DUF2726 domain-containing protein [Pantoea agglomerans]QAV47644.1 DUF2726 domain-containing protein [Pantoea agglomerans]QAV52308.1 DUF2726 domain-containing protein [Pantoea agglomerans]
MDMFFWVLIAIAVVAYLISGAKRKRKGGVYRPKTDYQPPKRESHERAPEVVREQSVAERQLVTVRGNEFYKRPLMNKSEYAVFCRLEKLLSTSHRGYRVFSQVSLGEILGSNDQQAYLAINSKRADFVIIDWSGQPKAVVEYHGSGHFQEDAILRDSVKREACSSAGIAFVELLANYTEADITAISVKLSANNA